MARFDKNVEVELERFYIANNSRYFKAIDFKIE